MERTTFITQVGSGWREIVVASWCVVVVRGTCLRSNGGIGADLEIGEVFDDD